MNVETVARWIWEAWYAAMSAQGREVAPERRSWETLPEQEKVIDRAIAMSLASRLGLYVTG